MKISTYKNILRYSIVAFVGFYTGATIMERYVSKNLKELEVELRDLATSLAKHPVSKKDNNLCTFVDAYSGQRFVSSKNKILDIVNEANAKIIQGEAVYLSDLYKSLGIKTLMEFKCHNQPISLDFKWNDYTLVQVEYLNLSRTGDPSPKFLIRFKGCIPVYDLQEG